MSSKKSAKTDTPADVAPKPVGASETAIVELSMGDSGYPHAQALGRSGISRDLAQRFYNHLRPDRIDRTRLGTAIRACQGSVILISDADEGRLPEADIVQLLRTFSESEGILPRDGLHQATSTLLMSSWVRTAGELPNVKNVIKLAIRAHNRIKGQGLSPPNITGYSSGEIQKAGQPDIVDVSLGQSTEQILLSAPLGGTVPEEHASLDANDLPRLVQQPELRLGDQSRLERHLRGLLVAPELRRLAKRFIAELEGTSEGGCSEVGDIPLLNVPGPIIVRPALVRFEEHLARSDTSDLESRGSFADGLASLADHSLPSEQFGQVIDRINQKCERTLTILREPNGQLGTIRFDEKRSQLEFVPIITPEAIIRSATLKAFEVVPIETLPNQEASVALGRLLGRRRAGLFDSEWQSRAAVALSTQAKPEWLSDRGRKGAKARWEKARQEKQIGDTSQERVIGTKEVAQMLGVGEERVRQLAKNGRIGKIHEGKYIFTIDEIDLFQRNRRSAGRPARKADGP